MRLQQVQERLNEARKENPVAELSDIAHSQEEMQQWLRDFAEERRLPVTSPEGFAPALQQLLHLSLLAPVRFADTDEDRFLVHRWTAGALEGRSIGGEQREAHHRAASYWQWRVAKLPQSRQRDIEDLLEARYHLRVIPDIPQFHEISSAIILQLDTWGAWEWEERLIREGRGLVPEASPEASWYLHQLGIIAHRRGDYDAALGWYRKSLATEEQGDNRAGMANSYGQLGRVAQDRGDYDAALDWYRKSLAIFEQFGDRAGMARGYHQLGMVEQHRGDYDSALDWYRKSLAIKEQLGDRVGIANSYHQLGIVAQDRNDFDAALGWYRKSLAIEEKLGNRAGMAISYGQLGRVAQDRGDYDAALDWYRRSLAIFEQLGDRAGMARCYHQLGTVAQHRGDYNSALDWYRKSLAIKEQLSDRVGIANSYHQLGIVAQDRNDFDAALGWYRQSLAIAEQLGDRAGMAFTISQMGALYTQTERAAEAVPLNLRSLSLRLEMESPQAATDLHWLSRQRSILGAEAFRSLVGQHVDAEGLKNVFALLDKFDADRKD